MPFVDPWLKKGDSMSPIEFERRQYEQTKNPMHVWNTVQMCSEIMALAPGRPIDGYPDWVYEHLGTVAERLRDLWANRDDEPIENFGATIAHAFDLKKAGQGKKSNAFENWDRARRDQNLASAVGRYLENHPGVSVNEACQQLADESSQHAADVLRRGYTTKSPEVFSEDAYRRAWQDWREFLDNAPWRK